MRRPAAGLVPAQAPLPGLGLLAVQLQALRAELAGPRPEPPAPPPARGKTRVRALRRFLDGSIGQYFGPGDVTDIDERAVRDLAKRGIVEVV